jgi:hypothetical protein
MTPPSRNQPFDKPLDKLRVLSEVEALRVDTERHFVCRRMYQTSSASPIVTYQNKIGK